MGGGIPWHNAEDFRFFKAMTLGKDILVGRRTAQNLPPLPNRKVFVLSRNVNSFNTDTLDAKGQRIFVKNITEEQVHLKPDLILCGGAELYSKFLPFCTELYLTTIKQIVDGDTFFPPFGNMFKFEGDLKDNKELRIERYSRNFLLQTEQKFLIKIIDKEPDPWATMAASAFMWKDIEVLTKLKKRYDFVWQKINRN